MNNSFQKTKYVTKYKIFVFILFLFFEFNTIAQNKAEIDLKPIVYTYNNALKYDSSIQAIHYFLNREDIDNRDRFNAYLYMSLTHKILQDYEQVHKYLDAAIKYGLESNQREFCIANYNCQKSFAYFDVSDYLNADSLMKLLSANDYKYLDMHDKGILMIQQAYLLLKKKNYDESAVMYKKAEQFIGQNCPCELPLVYSNEMQLFGARKEFEKMEECYKKGIAKADGCGVLKYKMLCTQNMYFIYRKSGDFERAIYYGLKWDSMDMIFKRKENILKLKDLDHRLQLNSKDDIISSQKNVLLENKIYINNLIFILSILISFTVTILLYRNKKLDQVKHNFRMQLNDAAFTKIEEERKRIASDLHDEVSHELILLKNSMNQFNENNLHKVDIIIEKIRNISRNIHPVMFDRVGLKNSLESMLERIQNKNQFLLSSHISYNKKLNVKSQIQIYRIIQEAINNIIKHSDGCCGRISIIEKKNLLEVKVEDNGKGFDVNKKLSSSDSFGLHNMRLRTELLNGKINIESKPLGTSITILIPTHQL